MQKRQEIITIVATTNNLAIGKGGDMLFYISDDLKRFKRLTSGYTIVMGRKTFESLPKGALPNRRNIVLSRTADHIDGAEIAHSKEEILNMTSKEERIFIIGGGEIYKQFLDISDKIYLTKLNIDVEGDTFFPRINNCDWEEESNETHFCEKNKIEYSFINLSRK